MGKLKYLVILFAAVLLLPMTVFAVDEEVVAENPEATETTGTEDSKEVNLYFFRGEGCPHCEEAEQWFQSIEEEYGNYFKVVDYETWYNEDNAALMQKVAEARGETAEGVPYIIIGDKSWSGFTESYEQEILDQIQSVYAQDVSARYDIMKYLDGSAPKKDAKDEDKGANDALVLILIILIAGGIGFGVNRARNTVK
ncbi:MAG: hypothetical protein IJG97_06560 [Bacilli bacterium]|nr:hypothetical protein [Bacilli bacterium]